MNFYWAKRVNLSVPPEDIFWYEELCRQGVIPGYKHMLLLVLGRYGKRFAHPDELSVYLDALQGHSSWMVCAFGPNEQLVMEEAIKRGGHCRVGFENNLEITKNVQAESNAELVAATTNFVLASGKNIMDAKSAHQLFSQ